MPFAAPVLQALGLALAVLAVLPQGLASASAVASPDPKIIVMMVIDDLGHADHTLNPDVPNPDIPTPNLKKLQDSGVRLSNMHSQPVCSPTRSALMTGRFPFRDGMQHETTILPGSTAAIPVTTPTVPELLSLGSTTKKFTSYAIGKWHLGYASFNNTPTGRGFQDHVGYLQGQCDYYNKTVGRGFDFWHGKAVDRAAAGTYSLHQYMAAAQQYIGDYARDAEENDRMFLYLSHQTVHIPLEAAGEDKRCTGIADYWRRMYCSMLVELDDSVGALVKALQSAVGDDWVILTISDNGGMVRFSELKTNHDQPFWPASAGDNRPLRGSKTTLFQGGVSSTSFISGGASMIPPGSRGSTYDGLMHAADIAATVLGLAGVNLTAHSSIDGIDHWAAAVGGGGVRSTGSSLRDHVPINIVNNGTSYSAVRFGDMKLILGSAGIKAPAGGWFKGGLNPGEPEPPHKQGVPYLFNLTADPHERTSLDVTQYADAVAHGTRLITSYVTSGAYSEPQPNNPHPRAFPIFHGGVWAPWLD